MDLLERREKFCFLTRFTGKWGLPWNLNLTDAEDQEPDGDYEVKEEEESSADNAGAKDTDLQEE